SDVDLLARARPESGFVGVTGTNGKSTTTALVGHVLASAGRIVAVGGNLGVPALSLEPLGKDGTYVLEMSSYQLEITPSLAFHVAVLLNLAPDHLGRHGGMAGYVAAKRAIFRGQRQGDTAVIGVDDETCRTIHRELVAREGPAVVPISATDTKSATGEPRDQAAAKGGVTVINGVLRDFLSGGAGPVIDLGSAPALPGVHNWQNAAAAYAAARTLGLGADEIATALRTFPGLGHRQERVLTLDGVLFVNDSKATNAHAAARALACYETIYWIAGGLPKEDGIRPLEHYFPRVVHAFLIGNAAADFARTLKGRVPYTLAGTLDRAVSEAHARATRDRRREPVVLLSPACASFDQFLNFEARGESFRRLVHALRGAQPVPAAP
ncbi:MAG: UDP-N-acetylmuramoyl-L-alanine--D-glutamate ligase, partial [Alphaproteobacteria bacterium]